MTNRFLKGLAAIGLADEPPPEEEKVQPKKVAPLLPGQLFVSPASIVATRVIAGDEACSELLDAVLEQQSAYTQFLKMTQSFKGVLTEDKIFPVALAAMPTMGITVESILSAISQHEGTLQSERKNFENALLGQTNDGVVAKEEEVKASENTIAERQRQIVALQNEIGEIEKNKSLAQEEISKHKAKIEAAKKQFDAAYNAVNQQISADKQKIASLKPTNS